MRERAKIILYRHAFNHSFIIFILFHSFLYSSNMFIYFIFLHAFIHSTRSFIPSFFPSYINNLIYLILSTINIFFLFLSSISFTTIYLSFYFLYSFSYSSLPPHCTFKTQVMQVCCVTCIHLSTPVVGGCGCVDFSGKSLRYKPSTLRYSFFFFFFFFFF